MTDIKELRRLAEADDYVTPNHGWPDASVFKSLFFSDKSAAYLEAATPSAILSLLDKIDAQEIEIKWLNKSLEEAKK